MIRRFLPLIGFMLVLSAVLGWLRADTDQGNAARRADVWERNAAKLNAAPDYASLTARLKSSGLFPMSKKRIEALELQGGGADGTGAVAGSKAPPFPVIIAASIVNGVAQVHLRLEDGAIIAAASGEALESGWQLKTVDLSRVIAVYDGEEHEFKVTNYKEREIRDDLRKKQAQ